MKLEMRREADTGNEMQRMQVPPTNHKKDKQDRNLTALNSFI